MTTPQALEALSKRIARIENGLLPILLLYMHRARPARLLDRMVQHHVPGVSVAVISNYRIEWARGYGLLETGKPWPITQKTIFQACSISKPVAAVAALRLVQEGKLDLDEDINTYLVSWKVPPNEAGQPRVTLRHLLSHTAGLTYCWYPGFRPGAKIPTLVQVLNGDAPANTPPVRVQLTPGTKFRYSGSHFSVVQQILVDVTGIPFPELMQELVFKPLGMYDSSYDQSFPQTRPSTTAAGHYIDGALLDGRWRIIPSMAGAGLWTTPSDLAQIAIDIQLAHVGKPSKVLGKQIVDQLLIPQTPVGGKLWGLGFGLQGHGADACFRHPGNNIGYKCILHAFSEGGMGAVVMTNGDDGDWVYKELLQAIAKEYNWSANALSEMYSMPVWRIAPLRLVEYGALHAFRRYLHFVHR
jgi:CubicO group peptidase (beta-lactamase class C family)